MKEKEAITKWCPYALATGSNRFEGNILFESMNCIASKCAMWKWHTIQSGNMPNLEFIKSNIDGQCGLIKG